MLMMQALPDAVKSEVIATRQLHAAGVLFRVLRSYQPGGLSERATLLAAITQTTPAKSALEAAESLRMWRRQVSRAMELEATLPDCTLQVRALDQIMSEVLSRDAQASFRVSTFRFQHAVDVQPSDATVGNLYDILLSEADQMVHGKLQADGMAQEQPTVKVLMAETSHKGAKSNLCKSWGTDNGCRFGQRCKFMHAELQDKSSRCWTCSSTLHRKAECPYRREEEAKGKGPGKTKGQGKTGKGTKGEASRAEVEAGKANAEGKPQRISEDQAQPKAAPVVKNAEKEAEQAGTGETEVMSEVASLIRTLRINAEGAGPSVRVIRLQRMSVEGSGMTLDGGATHCLRQAHSRQEWDLATEVRVQLAKGETRLRQDAQTGTLLSLEPTQPLVPVGKIVEIGYSLRWDRAKCSVEHPAHGSIPVQLAQGCPLVPEEWGTRMMTEIEEAARRQARIRCCIVALRRRAEKRRPWPKSPRCSHRSHYGCWNGFQGRVRGMGLNFHGTDISGEGSRRQGRWW